MKAIEANVGIALDGDADRVVMVDEHGNLLSGDELLYILAVDYKKRKNKRPSCWNDIK